MLDGARVEYFDAKAAQPVVRGVEPGEVGPVRVRGQRSQDRVVRQSLVDRL